MERITRDARISRGAQNHLPDEGVHLGIYREEGNVNVGLYIYTLFGKRDGE